MPRLTPRSFLRYLVLLILVTLSLGVLLRFRTSQASNSSRSSGPATSASIVVQAAGHGKGLLNPQDGRELKVQHPDRALEEAMRSGSARPLALATGDFDGDGAPDVVTGYRYFGTGILVVQRGNIDAFAPKDLKVYDRAAKGELPASFLTDVQTIQLPESPDFLLVGDFNNDGHKDLLTAARGGGLYLLAGDGRGGFETPERLQLPGQITALTAGAFGHAEGWLAVIAGMVGPQGPALAIFNQDMSGLSRTPTISPLPAEAKALVLGSFDDDPYFDLGVAAGNNIIIFHGQKPATPVSDGQRIELQSRIEQIDLGFSARELVAGNFIADSAGRVELVALSDNGALHLLQREPVANPSSVWDVPLDPSLNAYQARIEIRKRVLDELKRTGALPMWQPGNRQEWTARQLDAPIAPAGSDGGPALLTSSNISAGGTDDLVLLDAAKQQVHVLIDDAVNQGLQAPSSNAPTSTRVPVSLNVDSAPLAVLAMPQKINGERDLMILSAGHLSASPVPLAPLVILTVNNITDQIRNPGNLNLNCSGGLGDCSLREAVLKANINAGPSTINVPGSIGTYNLSVNNPASGTTGTIALPDLEIGSATNTNTA